MMKFFRKHRKAVSPVIAVMLLVAVAVAAVGAYFIWFRSFQTQTQKSVQETSEGALGGGLQVISQTDDGTTYYVVVKNTLNSGGIALQAVRISPGPAAGTTTTLTTANGLRSTRTPDTNVSIAAGQNITLRVTPSTTGATNPYTIATGSTRTFTFEANAGYVVVATYTDS